MMSVPRPAAFRHDPVVSVLRARDAGTAVHWDREPVLVAYRRLVHVAETQIPVPLCATPVAVPGLGVVVGSFDGRVRLLAADLQRQYWQRRLASAIYAPLVVDHARRHVIVATTRGEVACYDLRGTEIWLARTEGSFYARPLVLPDADVVVLASFGSRCIGLDLASGETVFDRPLPRPWANIGAEQVSHRDPYASPVATAEGAAIICCAEHVVALSADGTQLWQREIGHAMRSSAAVIDSTGEVVVCGVDGRCRFLDVTSGSQIATVDVEAKVVASPAVSSGIVAIGSATNVIFGVDAAEHSIRWRADGSPRDHTSVTVLPNGDFVATTTTGNAVARSCGDGAFLWETSQLLGLAEHDPAMDVTPVTTVGGTMYCGSYSGMLYRFAFRPTIEGLS